MMLNILAVLDILRNIATQGVVDNVLADIIPNACTFKLQLIFTSHEIFNVSKLSPFISKFVNLKSDACQQAIKESFEGKQGFSLIVVDVSQNLQLNWCPKT